MFALEKGELLVKDSLHESLPASHRNGCTHDGKTARTGTRPYLSMEQLQVDLCAGHFVQENVDGGQD